MPPIQLPALALPSAQTPRKPTTREMARVLRIADSGTSITAADAEALLHARGPDLVHLLEIAGRVRDAGLDRAGRPGIITYSRKVFIPLTHLCQDRCHYCIFVQTPGQLAKTGKSPFMSSDEVLEIARQGASLGCKEALFTLGDRPESRWSVAREWLADHGFDSTIEYVREMALMVLEETGLLPHLNPGVMSWAELQRLKPVAPSMGMMLETTATRLWSEKGGPHFGSPDKDPAVRLRVLDDAGRSKIPFTTGVLLGIGETYAERVDAMFAIREVALTHQNIQEVIVQNFRAKESTAMMRASDLETEEYVAAVAVTRLVLGEDARVQAPPNLTDAEELELLLRAGIDDWGGVSPLTPDHVNPERPWPQIDELARLTNAGGYTLRERLTAHPPFIHEGEPWIDARVMSHVRALADPSSYLAREGVRPTGIPWQNKSVDTGTADTGTADTAVAGFGVRPAVTALLHRAETNPAGLSDKEYASLLEVTGDRLDSLAAIADNVRRETVGDAITYVVNRNLDSSLLDGVDYDLTIPSGRAGGAPKSQGTRPPLSLSLSQFGDLVDEAVALGATEICMQGAAHPTLPGRAYLDLAAEVKRRQPDIHLHAFRPVEIADGAKRTASLLAPYIEALREAGVDSVPGTGARILDDAIRASLTGGTDISVADWLEIVTTAHRHGLKSTATMVYGHIESAADQVAHIRTLARTQDETGGFTEFIAMPFVPAESLVRLGSGSRLGPGLDESRALHAVARLMLTGRIDNIQVAWTKLGVRGSQILLQGGANDFGGVLIDGSINTQAGPESGRELTVVAMGRAASEIGRNIQQRTTTYGVVSAGRAIDSGQGGCGR